MSTRRSVESLVRTSDRVLRLFLSFALVFSYVQLRQLMQPAPGSASPAALSVSATVSAKPLLGGQATVHITVTNTDTTDKAYNISLQDLISSSRPASTSPQAVATFVSASDGNGNLPPTSVSTTPTTGDTTVRFFNIRDLAPGESFSVDLLLDISGDTKWQVGDSVTNAITVGGNTIPNQTIPDITPPTVNASAKVVPIVIKSKAAHQSTGVEQATGTGAARRYHYTIDVQNNYVGATQSVVVTDTIPDGIEYLGPRGASPAPTSVSRDGATGVTTLVWDLGTMAAGAAQQLAYDAGIRYDYYGTANGGVNRADGTALTSATAGAPIITTASAKKAFTNSARLQGSWLSSPATDTANASVTGAALTVAKSSDKTTGGLGTIINYTLTYTTSQYFSAIATTDSVLVHDHLPDGQILDTSSVNPAASAITTNTDGSTDITWTVGAVANTSGGSTPITFSAKVADNWEQPSYAGDPIVSGDSMTNNVDIRGECVDEVNGTHTNVLTSSNSSVGFATSLPKIFKQMKDPADGLWKQSFAMTVGDTSTVRVRFNTVDGATPLKSDINMGNIFLTDWLPAGMSIIPGTFHVTYSSPSDFTTPTVGTPPPINLSTPTTGTASGLDYASWYIGNVGPSGWLEATFDVVVKDVPAAADGVITANMWKLTGTNTFGTPYSQRDQVMISYEAPHLTLTKSVTPPSPLVGGTTVPYRIVANNTGSTSAHQVSVVDTLPAGMRTTTPTVTSVSLDSTPLANGTDYVTAWDSATGALRVSLQQGAVLTPLPAGSRLTVNYNAVVDAGQPAGSSLANTATVSYSTQATNGGHLTPGTTNVADDNTDAASITLNGCTIAKTGPSGPFTIGQRYTYNLDVTVPPRTVAFWPTVTDALTREGFIATGTPTITTQAGAPLVGASFANTGTAPVRSTPASGSTLFAFDLSDPIDNSNSATPYTYRISFDVIYSATRGAGSWEFAPPSTSDSASDTARVLWNTVHAASRSTNSSAVSNVVPTSFQQPLLNAVKSIVTTVTPGPYVGGQDILYRVQVTNTGSSRAHNVSFVDTMPAASSSATLTMAQLSGVGDVRPNASITSTTTVLRMSFDSGVSIGTTETLQIEYRVTLAPNVGAGVALTNTADVNWTSLPGAPAGSRTYNDGAYENWTLDTSTYTTSAAPATIAKRASTTGHIRIGDTVTYSIDCTVPANTVMWWPTISDRLNKVGVAYVSDSATITTRANPPAVPASFSATSTPTTSVAGGYTTFGWTLASPLDNSGNSQPYAFTLSFTVRYTGINGAAWEMWPAGTSTPANSITDTASASWRDVSSGGPAPNHTVVSNSVSTTVRQPLIRTVKTIVTTATPPPFVGGSPIRYRITLTNPGYNTAYDITATDTLPAEIVSANLVLATETGVGSILASTTSSVALPNATITFDPSVSVAPTSTQTITLEYDCVLAPTIGAGATLTNGVDANWSSMPGTLAGERVYNDSTQEGATWVQDTTNVTTTTPPASFSKRISSATTGTIGSAVVYSLDTTLPANETGYSLVVTDTVPDYLTVIAANASLPGTVTVGAPGPSGTLVTYDGGNIAGTSTPTTVSVTIFAQVRNARYSGPQVPSGAINNSALLSWRTRASGGTTITAAGGPVAFTVMQPSLAITKNVSATAAGPGDTITYTSVVTNTGNSPAYDLHWSDTANSSMTTPTLVSVKPSGLATLVAGTDFSTVSAATSLTVVFDRPTSPRIDPGQTVTITWTASAIAGVRNGASMPDTATINSYTSLPATSVARTYPSVSATKTVTALSPALVTSKSVVGSAYPLRGDTVHFRFTVRNVGTAPATAVTATDTLPADLTYVAGTTSANWPLGSSTNNPSGGAGPVLNWAPGVTLNPGQTLTVDFDAVVSASAATGTVINTVTAAATDLLGSAVPANAASWVASDTDALDRATAPVRIVQPGVALAKILSTGGDQFVQVGQQTGFRLTVANTGDTTLTPVALADPFDTSVLAYVSASVTPSSTTGGVVRWNSFSPIAPGASRSVNVTFTVLSQPASGVATNLASVVATDEFTHPVPGTQDTATVNVTRPSVSVSKVRHAGQDATIQVGEQVGFDLTVTNSGDTTLTTVPLVDTFSSTYLAYAGASTAESSTTASSVTWGNVAPLGSGGVLAPGASVTIVATFTAVAVPAARSTFDTASINGANVRDVHNDSTASTSSASSIAITAPSVTVVKARTTFQDPQIQVGQTVSYRLTVTNSGDTTLTSIQLSDAWDSAYLGSPVSSPAGTFGAGTGSWMLGPLAPGASQVVTLSLSAIAVPPGQITTDTATVSGTDENSDTAPGNSSSSSVRITAPAVGIVKSLHAGQDPQIQVGQTVRYDLAITNTGDTQLSTVPVTDVFDGAALSYTSATVAPTSVGAGTVSWNTIGALAVGQTTTLTVTFTAVAVPSGQVTTDTASVLIATDVWGDHPADKNASANVRITRPAVIVTKLLHPGQDPQIQVGEKVTYDITVTNTGDTTLDPLTVGDTWDGSVLAYDGSSPVAVAGSSGATWTIGPLAPAASQMLQLTLKATGAPASLSTTDVVSVTATDTYGDSATSTPAAASVMITHPDVAIAKSLAIGQDPVVQVGQSVTYDLRITNTGNSVLATVPVTDTFDDTALTYTTATVAPSSAGAGSLSWSNAGPLAVGETKIISVTFSAASVPAGQVTTNTVATAGGIDAFGDPVPSGDASASVQITHPAFTIAKTLRAGQDAAVQAGQAVGYVISVTNTGDTTLTTVPVTDTYDPFVLSFASAAPTESSAPAGTVRWNNIGPLAPGASATVVATFTALANPPGQVTTDTAAANNVVDEHSDSPPDATATAGVKVTAPSVFVTKTRVSDPAIQTSQVAIYELTATNSGDTTLTSTQVTDFWDAAALDYLSSSLPPSTLLPGMAEWDFGTLAPGASQAVTVTLVAFANVPGLTSPDLVLAQGTDENGDDTPPSVASGTVDITRPEVAVAKTLHSGQDLDIQVGQTVTYDLAVTNTGDTTLTTIPLSDTFDDAIFDFDSASTPPDFSAGDTVRWDDIGPLVVGETTTITVTLVARATSHSSVDTAAVTGGTDVNGDPAPNVESTATIRVTGPGVSILKLPAVGQDPQIQAGEPATFDIFFTNTGDTTLTALSLTDTWDPAVFAHVGHSGSATVSASSIAWLDAAPLAPGAMQQRQLTLIALAAPAGLTSTDTAIISGTDEFGDPAAETSASAGLQVTRPSVTVVKQRHAGQDAVIQIGQTVTYDLAVTNSGDTTLATVPLSDSFDAAALTFTTATVSPSSTGPGALSWANVGPLAQGETTTLTVTFTAVSVPAGQVTTDTATVTGVLDVYSDLAPDSSDSEDIRITQPDIAITKSLHTGQDNAVQAGEGVVFDVVVTNTGDTTLTTVPVHDTYDSAVLAFSSANPVESSTGAGTVMWDNVGPLGPGESATVTVSFSALTNPAGQATENVAGARSVVDEYGDSPGDATASASVKVTAPSLSLAKHRASADPIIQSGQTVTFDLTVTNTGDTTLTAVPLTDTWDANYLLFSSSAPVATAGTNFATWDVAPLAPSATATVTVTLLAVKEVPGFTTIDTATVTGALDENSDHANDAISTDSVAITRPEVTVHKSPASGQDPVVQVGQTVTYDITITNSGDTTLAVVPLADSYDSAVFDFSSSTPAPSVTSTGLVSWDNVGPLTVGQTATVTVTVTAVGTSDVSASVDTATVSGATDVNGDSAPTDFDTAGAIVTRPAVSISKQLAAGQAANVPLGEQVTYDLVVTNTGDTTLATVPLADTFDPAQLQVVSTSVQPTDPPVPGVVSWSNVAGPLGMAPGASVHVPITFTTLVSGPQIPDTAAITGASDQFGDPAPHVTDTNSTLGVYEPGLFHVAKTANPEAGTIVLPGDTITYTLSWNNDQPVTVPGVVVSDPLPGSVDYAAGTLVLGTATQTDAADGDAGRYDAASRTVIFDIGDVSAMSSGTASFQVAVGPESRSAAGIMNSAPFTSGNTPLGVAGPVYHPVDPFTIVKSGKDLNGGKLKGGDVIEWTIKVTNTGLTPTTNVRVTDTVPNTTTYVDDSITGRGADDSAAPKLVWNIGTMQVGEVQVLTMRSRVKKGLAAGTQIRNQATVVSDQSRPKKSDNPKTSTDGDPTIMVAQTSGSEDWRLPLSTGLMLLAAGVWLYNRRRKVVLAHEAQAAARRAAREARSRNA